METEPSVLRILFAQFVCFGVVLDVLVFTMIILTVTSCIGYLLHIFFFHWVDPRGKKSHRKEEPVWNLPLNMNYDLLVNRDSHYSFVCSLLLPSWTTKSDEHLASNAQIDM